MIRFFIVCILYSFYVNSFAFNIECPDTVVPVDRELPVAHFVDVPDSQYLMSLDSIIDVYDKQLKIKQAVADYESTMLDKEMQLNVSSLFPVVKGVFTTMTNRRFRGRNSIFEHKDSPEWEYLPALTPMATTWILKAVGLESRSKMKRMVVANSLAFGIGIGTAKLLKMTAGETRPDGYDDHGMPSGHATIAFISATIFDREYGHYSPWISVGGYATAMATQFHRIHKNAHYLNDVVMGAGIGVVSTNLAYFLTDKIFGEKQINRPYVSKRDMFAYSKFLNIPTSFSLYSNVETGHNYIDPNDCLFDTSITGNFSLRSTSSMGTALEFDWFLNSNWAIEALGRLTQTKVQVLDNVNSNPTVYGNNVYQYHIDLGVKYSMLVGLDKRMAVRAFVGDRIVPATNFYDIKTGVKAISIKKDNNIEIGGGISVDMLSTTKYVSGFSCDYTHTFSSLFTNRWVIGSYFKIIL